MRRLLKYGLCAVLLTPLCFWVIAPVVDMATARTINLVEQEPQNYPEMCGLHSSALLWDRVRIGYGLVLNAPNDRELFPYSNKWVDGGCLGGGPRYGFLLYCQQCREAESAHRDSLARED